MIENIKVIKMINTRRYEIQLVQTSNGYYRVAYEGNMTEARVISEPIDDYNTASMMFDLKVRELEGH